MIRSLGSAGLTLLTLAAGLGLYFVSYNVGQERGKIESLSRQIDRDQNEIRMLEAELRVRANLPQLERWNANVLALKAPKAGQMLESDVQLAALVDPNRGAAITPATVRLAAVKLPAVVAPAERTASNDRAPHDFPAISETRDRGLFSTAFVAEIDAAAANERASLTKVALR